MTEEKTIKVKPAGHMALKLEYAKHSLDILKASSDIDPDAFFYFLNVFLGEAHDATEILRYKWGYKNSKTAASKGDYMAKMRIESLNKPESKEVLQKIKEFDKWVENNPTYRKIMSHTLTYERNAIKHRDGFAGVHYLPKDYREKMKADNRLQIQSGNILQTPIESIVTPDGKVLDRKVIPKNYPEGFTYLVYEKGEFPEYELLSKCEEYLELIKNFIKDCIKYGIIHGFK